jgi:hypothetical protein
MVDVCCWKNTSASSGFASALGRSSTAASTLVEA